MSVDSAGHVPPHKHANRQQIPDVVAVQAHHVRYKTPRRLTAQGKDRHISSAVEIVVETAEPLPIRALNPVLFVGETPLTIAEGEGDRRYRFLAPKPDDLKAGAAISIGWSSPGTPRQKTRFTYQPPTQLNEER
jgi:hypothetical protein